MQQFPPFYAAYTAVSQQGQPNQDQQQPLSLSGSNLAIYSSAHPLPVVAASQVPNGLVASLETGVTGKPKRKQVKNACVNCQKACKKCDEERPCPRCVKYGIDDTCVNSVRKERKKGIKRGPYKKRNHEETVNSSSGTSTPNISSASTAAYGRTSALPIHYQPFNPQAPYDPYGYVNNGQVIPQAYAVPTGIPQMYPTNPSVLSYQPSVKMDENLNNAVKSEEQPSGFLANVKSENTNSTTTPTDSTSTKEEETKSKIEEDDEDEKSKLNILSQLCSAVLGSNSNNAHVQESDEETGCSWSPEPVYKKKKYPHPEELCIGYIDEELSDD